MELRPRLILLPLQPIAPRVAGAAACLECELLDAIPVPGTRSTHWRLARGHGAVASGAFLGPRGYGSTKALRPVPRALNDYTRWGGVQAAAPQLGHHDKAHDKATGY